MVIFNSYVKLPEGTQYMKIWKSHQCRSSSLENPDFHILLLECLPSNVAIKEKTKLQLPCQFQVVLLGNQGRCSLTARLCQRIHHRIWRFGRDPQVFSEIIQSCGKRLGPNHPNHGILMVRSWGFWVLIQTNKRPSGFPGRWLPDPFIASQASPCQRCRGE